MVQINFKKMELEKTSTLKRTSNLQKPNLSEPLIFTLCSSQIFSHRFPSLPAFQARCFCNKVISLPVGKT